MKLWPLFLAVLINVLPAFGGEGPSAEESDEGWTQPLQDVFVTELVYPQERGEVQVTVAPGLFRNKDEKTYEVPLLLEYGLTDAWQVELESSSQRIRPDGGSTVSGAGDLEIGTKYSFMAIGGSTLHAAVGLDVALPVGDETKGLGEGVVEFEPYVSLARDFPELNGLQLFTQVGLGLIGSSHNESEEAGEKQGEEEEEPEAHELFVNGGVFIPFRSLRFVTELNWTTNRWNRDGDESAFYVTPAIVWDLPGTWESALGSSIGLAGDADHFRLLAMLTYEFGGDAD